MLQQAECTKKNNCKMAFNNNYQTQSPSISTQLPMPQADSHLQFMDTSEISSQNRIPSFKTNTNPFAKNATLSPPQQGSSQLLYLNGQQRIKQKPSFLQIQNKNLGLDESQIQNQQSCFQNFDDRFNQLMQTSMGIIHHDNNDDLRINSRQQEVVIGGEERYGIDYSYVSQTCSSSSSDMTTSSCIQWEQVMQNRRNLVSILQEVVLDSNTHIQTQNNKFYQDSIKPSKSCESNNINQFDNQNNNSPNNKTQYSVQHNEYLEREWEKEQQATPIKNKYIKYHKEKDELQSDDNDSQHQDEEEEEEECFDEKESLYFIKKQHKQSLFGSLSMNNINNHKNHHGMMTKTTMNTINNLSTMTTINQNFSPQINKRNSKCFVPQPINLN